MKKTVLIFGILVFALLLLFQISKYAMVTGSMDTEIIIAIVAIVFFIVGVYLHKKSLHTDPFPKTGVNLEKTKSLEISPREYEVLKEVALGLSNKEIADKLFVSESTIKTHVSNLLVKLNAKRRTHAIQIAQELKII
ncbi:response regulator transcription factor [Maribacter aquimaris]|nr:response regulator transcription factor [Maribacter aquimaris]